MIFEFMVPLVLPVPSRDLQRMVEAGMTGIRMNLSHGPFRPTKIGWISSTPGIPSCSSTCRPELQTASLPQPL